MRIKEYERTVQYYETDKMGITHHSNYIRWMEEARVDYLEQIKWSYAKLEEMGIISPVISVDVTYKKPTTFSDFVSIKVDLVEYNGIKLTFSYEMKNAKKEVVCLAKSSHCFVSKNGLPVIVKDKWPELDKVLKGLVVEK